MVSASFFISMVMGISYSRSRISFFTSGSIFVDRRTLSRWMMSSCLLSGCPRQISIMDTIS